MKQKRGNMLLVVAGVGALAWWLISRQKPSRLQPRPPQMTDWAKLIEKTLLGVTDKANLDAQWEAALGQESIWSAQDEDTRMYLISLYIKRQQDLT